MSPVVKEGWQSYEKPDWPPDLEWHSVHRGTEQAGELLAQFELLEVIAITALCNIFSSPGRGKI